MEYPHLSPAVTEFFPPMCPSRGRPIDLVHLASRSSGNRSREEELLCGFVRSARQSVGEMRDKEIAMRKKLANALGKAAKNVGAFGVSRCAGKIARSPADETLLDEASALLNEAENFIAGLTR